MGMCALRRFVTRGPVDGSGACNAIDDTPNAHIERFTGGGE
jgi:hypothetical protein